MRIEVTSAARHEQRAEDVPAVYVMTQEEIHRSGMTTIPDLLRLVPDVQVAQANSNKWAVSVRGFNGLASNKTLVVVDTRSIYNPAFSTVLWDTEDLPIEDIDRIEVVRGPGGAMWGANAANGVINIITKPSASTQGVLARVSTGTCDTAGASLRYGGAIGRASYRVFAQAADHGDSTMVPGSTSTSDRCRTITSGMRADWSAGAHAFMMETSASNGRQRPLWYNLDPENLSRGNLGTDAVSESSVGTALGRWTVNRRNGTSIQIQGYFDHANRDETVGIYNRRTWDIDAQYHQRLGRRHDLVAGGGYLFTPNAAQPIIVNGFGQHAITLVDRRLELTLGAKFENNTFAGSGLQPSTHLLWTITPAQRVWTSAARAIRTPSLIDRGFHVEYPPLPQPNGTLLIAGASGNRAFHSGHLINTEGGYHLTLASVASIDIVGFVGRYHDLQTYEPQLPTVSVGPFGVPLIRVLARNENRLRADTAGRRVHRTISTQSRMGAGRHVLRLSCHTASERKRRSERRNVRWQRATITMARAFRVHARRARSGRPPSVPRRPARAAEERGLHAARRPHRMAAHATTHHRRRRTELAARRAPGIRRALQQHPINARPEERSSATGLAILT